MRFQVSDWVQGHTESGELVHGFVVARYEAEAAAKVHVVKSDNEETVGRRVVLRDSRMKELPETADMSRGQLEDLINLALVTRDEAWFFELSARLKQGSQKDGQLQDRSIPYSSAHNRLGSKGLK